jgi:receptor expression-enhancing protein 5/6
MNPPKQDQPEVKKSVSIDKKDLKANSKTDTPKSSKNKIKESPGSSKKLISLADDNNKDFCLSFREIYDFHVQEIEQKTKLKINHIYIFFIISFIFFMIGHFELIFSYIITIYYPILWTWEDYKARKDNFGKKWGTYWVIFSALIFFDLHKKEVLKIIPLYFLIKCIFLLMLYLPGFNTAEDLYDGLLKDYIILFEKKFKNKDECDTMLNEFKKNIKVKTE